MSDYWIKKWHRSCLGKKRFKNYDYAAKFGKKWKQRAYLCQFCGGYHLTTKAFERR